MLEYVLVELANGRTDAEIMALGGNTQVLLRVKLESADEIGIVCRVRGLMGGLGEPQARPWACISHICFI